MADGSLLGQDSAPPTCPPFRRRHAGAALGVELRRMMTRFLLFHQTQDTTAGPSRRGLNVGKGETDGLYDLEGVRRTGDRVSASST